MGRWYPVGYLVILCGSAVFAHHDKIIEYNALAQTITEYVELIQQHTDIKNVPSLDLYTSYDHAVINIKNVSEIVCSCITTSNLSKNASKIVKCNAVLQMVVATYTVLQGFLDTWLTKKAIYQQRVALNYPEIMVTYPVLGLLQQQIILMNHLIDMCMYGSLPERIFAKIKLCSTVLPDPYNKLTKKWAKKLYKMSFDSFGNLFDATNFVGKHPYKNFTKKISMDWKVLLYQVDKMPSSMQILYASPYYEKIVNSDYNQRLLAIIDAGMKQDAVQIISLCDNQSNDIIELLYSFYCS